MKPAVHKVEIPASKAFVIDYLDDAFFDTNWHFHSEYQLFVVLEGTGTRFIGDNISHFQEGDMVFTGPNVPHLWRNDDLYFQKENPLRVRGVVVYFPENFLGEQILRTEEMHSIRQLLEKSCRGLAFFGQTNQLVTRRLLDLLELKGVDSIVQLLTILGLLADSGEYRFISSLGYTNTSREADKDRMSDVYNYIMRNFKRNIMLEEVAEIANMSPTAFSRYFKTRTNKSFTAFVSELRIGFACKQLMEGKGTIAQICYECGYNTLSNFNKQFKELMHKTPFEYRRQYLQMT